MCPCSTGPVAFVGPVASPWKMTLPGAGQRSHSPLLGSEAWWRSAWRETLAREPGDRVGFGLCPEQLRLCWSEGGLCGLRSKGTRLCCPAGRLAHSLASQLFLGNLSGRLRTLPLQPSGLRPEPSLSSTHDTPRPRCGAFPELSTSPSRFQGLLSHVVRHSHSSNPTSGTDFL